MGESGCGKTTLALAILGLLPPAARVRSGSVEFRRDELMGAGESTLRKIRGAQASIIFQEPALSLNPVMRVGTQIAEVVRAHTICDRRRCRKQAESALAQVHLPEKRIYSAYPCQLSAGQRQRVAIAQALVCGPALLIADEPTSALDNITQFGILELLRELKQRLQLAVLFITHNPAILAGLADRVLVMHAGRIVEEGSSGQVMWAPKHPRTKSLLAALPRMPGKQLVEAVEKSGV